MDRLKAGKDKEMKHIIFELAEYAAKKEDSNLAEIVQSMVSVLTDIKNYPESWHDIGYELLKKYPENTWGYVNFELWDYENPDLF